MHTVVKQISRMFSSWKYQTLYPLKNNSPSPHLPCGSQSLQYRLLKDMMVSWHSSHRREEKTGQGIQSLLRSPDSDTSKLCNPVQDQLTFLNPKNEGNDTTPTWLTELLQGLDLETLLQGLNKIYDKTLVKWKHKTPLKKREKPSRGKVPNDREK